MNDYDYNQLISAGVRPAVATAAIATAGVAAETRAAGIAAATCGGVAANDPVRSIQVEETWLAALVDALTSAGVGTRALTAFGCCAECGRLMPYCERCQEVQARTHVCEYCSRLADA